MKKLVAGLGNPGSRYDRTRHNIGFEVLDALVAQEGGQFRKSFRHPVKQWKAVLAGQATLCVKPQRFMNRSGEVLARLIKQHGLSPQDLVVIVDDVELDVGRIRIRAQGGPGLHNGLKSIVQQIGSKDFVRIRVGVGPRPSEVEMISFVLGRYRPDEKERIELGRRRAVDAVLDIVENGVESAMNRYNAME